MPTPSRATDADWALVESLWKTQGLGWSTLSRHIDGRAAATTIKRRAVADEWARDVHGVEISARPKTEALVAAQEASLEARKLIWAEERERVMSKLIATADHLLDRITQPHELIEVKVVPGPKGEGSEVETIHTPISQPLPGDQQRLMTSAAIAYDKILLLAGEATSRSESIDLSPEARVARAQQMRDDLAAKREANEAAKTGATG